MSKLVALNGFEKGPSGVFRADGGEPQFDYSDGQETEARLFKILSQASDLSSQSEELQGQIVDWPTEYHLSTTRSNLLRPFNFSGVRRVLELGCGCGSITRFLGEQESVQVDSVEGSSARAGLAALRCRDQANVRISVANFNDLVIPENYYDLVLFVGVTEYAGRFSDQSSDQQALQDLLSLAKKATTSGGVTLVAIENRLGLKYLLGANEDHYAVRFVGLDDYLDSTGIRTYSKTQWQQQISRAGFAASKFAYPFPDYKVPTVMLTDEVSSDVMITALDGLKSRDYAEPFDLGESEHRAWQGLLDSGSFAEHVNSFVIMLSDHQSAIAEFCDFDIQVYHQPKLDYLTPNIAPKAKPSRIESRLKSEVAQLTSHSANLEQKLELVRNSLSWRLVNLFRRLLGKPGI